jgi:hypothetical protein
MNMKVLWMKEDIKTETTPEEGTVTSHGIIHLLQIKETSAKLA